MAIKLPEHSERVFSMVCDNSQAAIEVLCYSEPQPGEYPLDRIHVLITDQDGNKRGWLMTPGEARSLMIGLDLALEKSDALGIREE